jgi:hypothetical protein
MGELELDVWPIIVVLLELERREELMCPLLVALVIDGPEGCCDADPSGEATELLLYAESAESREVNHSGVLELPPVEQLEVVKLMAGGDGEELSLVLIGLVGVLLRGSIALLGVKAVGGVLARSRAILRRNVGRGAG